MPRTDAQARATSKYRAGSTHSFSLVFFPKDEQLWEHLQNQPKKAEYLRELIKKDMENGAK